MKKNGFWLKRYPYMAQNAEVAELKAPLLTCRLSQGTHFLWESWGHVWSPSMKVWST